MYCGRGISYPLILLPEPSQQARDGIEIKHESGTSDKFSATVDPAEIPSQLPEPGSIVDVTQSGQDFHFIALDFSGTVRASG